MKLFIIFYFFAFMFCTTHVNAQIEKKTILLGGSGSLQALNNDPVLHLNPNVGYFVADKFVLGLEATSVNSKNYNFIGLGPYARGYFVNLEGGSVFGQAGINYARSSVSNNSESDLGLGLGLGFAMFLNNVIALEFSGNFSKYGFMNKGVLFSDSAMFTFDVGFQIHFKK